MDNNKNTTPKNNFTTQSLPVEAVRIPSIPPSGSGRAVELRSEKVRNIIGKIPSALVRYGTIIIGLALLSVVLVSVFIPYRETIPVKISIERSESGILGKTLVSKDQLTKIQIHNNVVINDPQLGYLQAGVSKVSSQPSHEDGFMREVEVSFPRSVYDKIQKGDVMEGRIVLSDVSVLRKFLQSLRLK